ncbi:NADH:flavin oxidoreductase/NADH oxidase [Phytomonospora endophytica]|uniref:2,4-dienoyl-CoA reductase-like NADH-dependent reductase (Old Yellow Enzyme family) n=1 Tax=Phytomonospora endophytica TaxID=714109 RepID=A0A841FXU9_9ACTN|nr:NADH:flavin oxidoreductase/NADH oxidase [Phytomonospora endophytica]MBB6038362.1 2,4-dienoyl-CoA reductase-like NADH-dependent reductase (Old Yellow Enzyme family) [Phytomonospora endophytica]GIG64293.1 oxidoreductase [Phytomonospora endophytica]
MTSLFEPFTLRSLTVPNRAWMAPMCQYSALPDGPDTGAPLDWHLAHLGARAVGGTGLILTEATAVSPEGRISPYDLGLWNERQTEAFARVTAFLRSQGTVPGIQLAHAGRKASTERPWKGGGPVAIADGGWRPVGPSPVPFADGYPVPHELSTADIAGIVADFAAATRRARDAGFQVVEVHGAHGYLISSFLSPQANHRTDAYGGSFANRVRFALDVVDAVRGEWPDELPVFFRASATDWLPEGGWTPDDTVALAAELKAHGVDLLDASSGGNVTGVHIPAEPGYQVPFAGRVRRESGLATGAVGLITDAAQADTIVASGEADAVFLGRALLRDPNWVRAAARELGAEVRIPEQYLRAV